MRMRRPRKLSRPVERSVSGAQSGSFSKASGHGTSRSAYCAATHHRTAFSRLLWQRPSHCQESAMLMSGNMLEDQPAEPKELLISQPGHCCTRQERSCSRWVMKNRH